MACRNPHTRRQRHLRHAYYHNVIQIAIYKMAGFYTYLKTVVIHIRPVFSYILPYKGRFTFKYNFLQEITNKPGLLSVLIKTMEGKVKTNKTTHTFEGAG